jgi:hypothetical protein
VDLLPSLVAELRGHKAASPRNGSADLVFPAANGSPRDKDNVRAKVVVPAVRRANELLEDAGHPPLPAGVRSHKLRHSFASLLVALGNDPAYVMDQLGHADPKFTLKIYTHGMRRGAGDKKRLQALVEGVDWAPLGTGSPSDTPEVVESPDPRNDEAPDDAGASDSGRYWARTSDLLLVEQALSQLS